METALIVTFLFALCNRVRGADWYFVGLPLSGLAKALTGFLIAFSILGWRMGTVWHGILLAFFYWFGTIYGWGPWIGAIVDRKPRELPADAGPDMVLIDWIASRFTRSYLVYSYAALMIRAALLWVFVFGWIAFQFGGILENGIRFTMLCIMFPVSFTIGRTLNGVSLPPLVKKSPRKGEMAWAWGELVYGLITGVVFFLPLRYILQ